VRALAQRAVMKARVVRAAVKMDGYLSHDGGAQPVSDYTQVTIVCRGDVGKDAIERWVPANTWRWDHRDNDSDIVFYKVKQ
jgi:hypothetical protein